MVTTLTVDAAANAGTNGADTVCTTASAVDLQALLGGTPDAGGTWNDDDATGALTGSTFDATQVSIGTYNFTYTVAGTGACTDATATVSVTVETCIGIDEKDAAASWAVYPNPTWGEIALDISSAIGKDVTVEILNLLGETVYRQTKLNETGTLTVDLSENATGVYYVKISSEENVKTVRLVLSK